MANVTARNNADFLGDDHDNSRAHERGNDSNRTSTTAAIFSVVRVFTRETLRRLIFIQIILFFSILVIQRTLKGLLRLEKKYEYGITNSFKRI